MTQRAALGLTKLARHDAKRQDKAVEDQPDNCQIPCISMMRFEMASL
ncbi:MAG: hypothetical protein WAV38_10920 [Xanthobacteraceae bacterium]